MRQMIVRVFMVLGLTQAVSFADPLDDIPDGAVESGAGSVDIEVNGEAGRSPIKDDVIAATTPGSLWEHATDLGGGWRRLGWFGDFSAIFSPWIYHNTHGWLYTVGDANSVFFYDPILRGGTWWWTSAVTYPNVYRFADGAWLFYQVGSSNPRWFYNYSTRAWEGGSPGVGLSGLLGTWRFLTTIISTFTDNYFLDRIVTTSGHAVITGTDLDENDLIIVARIQDLAPGSTLPYDYGLLDTGPILCDFFVFNVVGSDAVEGVDAISFVDRFGNCGDVVNAYPMTGTRLRARVASGRRALGPALPETDAAGDSDTPSYRSWEAEQVPSSFLANSELNSVARALSAVAQSMREPSQ